MIRFFIAVLLGGLGAAALLAQASVPRGYGSLVTEDRSRQDADERVLLRLEDDWATALVRRDVATFRRLLADGFVYTEDDRTSSRDAVLREIVAGTDTVEAAHNEDMRVHRFSTTAVVTGWLIVRGHGAGGPFEGRYRFTDTWMRRGGGWQILAAHDYLVPARSR